jgi:hypothetical protein
VVSVASPPTSLKGIVSDTTYDAWLGEALELIPNLVYPLSNATYTSMRRDPQLAAILAGWTLQIRQATWAVDPAGCRPEVAQLVADDLGLPIMGDDQPRAARVRGVSWAEHLRTALLSLVYGHYGFEMQVAVRDGLVRLIALAERPPHTITYIHTDPRAGSFLGVSQDQIGNFDVPQIKADRMVWYCHDREGTSFQGQSLLRPAYGPWLLKKELQRVLATSSRRFGMGVPTMKALAGTQPTEAQMSSALGLATSARVGESGGAVVPPGFVFELVGMTGSTPDTLAFIKYLDQQASRMALMGHMDLGETTNGSRALGDTFVNVLMMALRAVASNLADTVTRQVAARLVEWNWGLDEPVPTVAVSNIGSQRDVNAESLSLLMQSGALAADPALESWVRREFRLPEREPQSPPPLQPPPPVPPPAVTPAPASTTPATTPVAAARSRARRRPQQGQLALFAAGDDPEPDYAAIQQQWVDTQAGLLEQWPGMAQPMVDELTAQAQTAASGGDIAALGTLAVSAGVVAAVSLMLGGGATGLAVEAASNVVAEAAAQGVAVVAPDRPGTDRVQQTAEAVAALIAAGYSSGAAKTALQSAGADPDVVAAAVRAHLDELGTSTNGLVGENVGALLSAAQNAGRIAVLEAAPAATYVATEQLDSNTCLPCAGAHGTEFSTLEAALAVYPASGNRSCLGRGRCRGFVRAVWN